MVPKASFFEGFTNEGRIKKLWGQAVVEPNPQIALIKLREVRQRLYENPAGLHHLWLPFIDTFFGPAFLNRLTNQDVLAIEDMGVMHWRIEVPALCILKMFGFVS